MSSGLPLADAWELTQAISPRDRVRVASVDASGVVLNQYAFSRPIDGARPPVPWAVHLASADGYRLVAFDLDAKYGAAAAARDADTIGDLLADLGIEHLICQSGPSGGRHVWLACTAPLDPQLVASLGRLLTASCASLDTAPLSNPATGCVRPPGSPHRDGGFSTLLHGDPAVLRAPATTPTQIRRLVERLAAAINGSPASSADAPIQGPVCTDSAGQPYLPGNRRPLPRASAAALNQPVNDADASAHLWKVLLGAVASHWHHAELAELAATAPGLEHLRSRRDRGAAHRRPRSRYDAAQTLARQWRYAVRYAAANPRSAGDDDTFDQRAGDLADTVRALQTRADSVTSRWQLGGGPTDRRVLNTLHTFAISAMTPVIEADVRRIAVHCGIGRETARVALLRLTADGWITLAAPALGVHGASWNIDPQGILHRELDNTRSQAATRPAGAGAAERNILLQHLQQTNAAAAHDVFSSAHALPHRAGNTYAALSRAVPQLVTSSVELDDLVRLRQHGLVEQDSRGWTRSGDGVRDAVAVRIGVSGRLQDRRDRYVAERAVWGWWQAEHEWMKTPRADRQRRAAAGQVPLWNAANDTRYPRHPRRTDGRADYSGARAAYAAGALDRHVLAA